MRDSIFRVDPELIFGKDTINRAGALCGALRGAGRIEGGRALVMPGKDLRDAAGRLCTVLEEAKTGCILGDELPADAAADGAVSAAALAKGARCSVIIGLGGPAVQALSRLAAVLAYSPGGLYNFLDGEAPRGKAIPCIAVPTVFDDPFLLSGAFAVTDPRDKSAKVIAAPPGLCEGVIFDWGLAPAAKNFSGLCAAIEGYVSSRASFLSDALLEPAIALYGEVSSEAPGNASGDESPDNDGKAEKSAQAAALMAIGCAMSAGGTHCVPGIGTALALAMEARFGIDREACAAILLPLAAEFLAPARPEKFARIAALLGATAANAAANAAADGTAGAESAAAGIAAAVEGLRRRTGVARLGDFGLNLDQLVPIAETARSLNCASPVPVSTEDAYEILKKAL